jgi:exodeoxyribonuclease VII small subunit
MKRPGNLYDEDVKMSENTGLDEMKYEQALDELERIIESLENDQAGLEEAIALFERGQELVQHCGGLLDKAELRIRQLVPDDLQDTGEEEA